MILEPSLTVPAQLGERLSSSKRLASSMSSSRPVSFHQPWMMCGSTRDPWSTSHWIASVISSSFRADGLIPRTASKIRGVKR